jgi:hypothetical protein
MKRLAGEWLDYDMKVIPREAPEIQRRETRRAYYAGATTLLALILQSLEPGAEPTEGELRKMDQLKEEIDKFWVEVKAGRA